ncbi:hypothetical protein D3C80_2227590 [compost metagenome]
MPTTVVQEILYRKGGLAEPSSFLIHVTYVQQIIYEGGYPLHTSFGLMQQF